MLDYPSFRKFGRSLIFDALTKRSLAPVVGVLTPLSHLVRFYLQLVREISIRIQAAKSNYESLVTMEMWVAEPDSSLTRSFGVHSRLSNVAKSRKVLARVHSTCDNDRPSLLPCPILPFSM